MIKKEQFICQRHNQSILNQQLANELETLKNKYDRLFNEAYSANKNETLSNMYEPILLVNEVPMVKKQAEAISIYQQLFLT